MKANLPPIGSVERYKLQLDILHEALRRIACQNDSGANNHLQATGSYSRFDEPASVKIARDAIARAYAA